MPGRRDSTARSEPVLGGHGPPGPVDVRVDSGVSERKHRRLVVRSDLEKGGPNKLGGAYHGQIDLTGIFHANAMFGIYAEIEEQCNLGDWHVVSSTSLPCWGDA